MKLLGPAFDCFEEVDVSDGGVLILDVDGDAVLTELELVEAVSG